MAKAIKVDWSTSDSQKTTPIATLIETEVKRKEPLSEKPRLITPTVEGLDKKTTEAGGSQKQAVSQKRVSFADDVDPPLQVPKRPKHAVMLTAEYEKHEDKLNDMMSTLRSKHAEVNRSREKFKEILQDHLPNISLETKKNQRSPKQRQQNQDRGIKKKKQAVKINQIKSIVKTLRQLSEKVNIVNKLKYMDESLLNKMFCVHRRKEEKKRSNSEKRINLSYDSTLESQTEESDTESIKSDESFNRSSDKYLLTNIRTFGMDIAPAKDEALQTTSTGKDEWIPIGGGATLIHKDNYSKVNWKTYTVATRTLLLATFSRSTLATHSLTGKRSPAFQNKPAKMGLDQRIVCDIIDEVSTRFNVKANHVRSIITTKCADEAKMQRMRLAKETANKSKTMKTDSMTS